MPRFLFFLFLFLLMAFSKAAYADWVELPLSDLQITSGQDRTRLLGSGLIEVKAPVFRATSRSSVSTASQLSFAYREALPNPEPTEGGQVRIQVGQKLMSKDPCNLIYVMWRLFPQERIVVSVKRHSGSTSAECGGQGYTNVASIAVPADLSARSGSYRDLQSVYDPSTRLLSVQINGREIWEGSLPTKLVRGLSGPVGVRADNGHFRFRFYSGQ